MHLSDARHGVWLCLPGKPTRWRRFPGEVLSGPPAEVGQRRAGAEAREPRPGSPLRQLLLTAPRQYQPGLTRSSMLVPGSTRPTSKKQVRATCRRLGRRDAEVSAV